MEKIITKSFFIVFVTCIFLGCSLKSNELIELKPNLKNLTKRANSAIKRRGINQNDVLNFLNEKYPILMSSFENYDLKVRYENNITTVLVCKNNIAIYEDLSCDIKIDNVYIDNNLSCDFYVKKIRCKR